MEGMKKSDPVIISKVLRLDHGGTRNSRCFTVYINSFHFLVTKFMVNSTNKIKMSAR